MKDMNKSFEQLKKRVPLARRGGKRTSKIRLLHLAIKYIKHLKFLLSFPVGQTIPPQIGNRDVQACFGTNHSHLFVQKKNLKKLWLGGGKLPKIRVQLEQ